jgi:hypothetical protein
MVCHFHFHFQVESGRQKSGAKLASVGSGGANGSNKSGLGKKSGGSKMKLKIKGRGAVDEDSGLADSAHILEERDDVWTFTGTVADVTSGINSYYILQLIEADNKNKFYVFRKSVHRRSQEGPPMFVFFCIC